MEWAKVYLRLDEERGMSAEEVNRLTLYQVAMYLGAPVPELGRVRLTREQFFALYPEKAARLFGKKG